MHAVRRRISAGTMGGLAAVAALGIDAAPARALAQTERLAYTVMYGGLHVGDAVVELKQTPDSYATGLKLSARGVAKWLGEFRADLSGAGAMTDDPAKPLPETYRRDWKGSEVAATMLMTYDPGTRLTRTQETYINVETGAEMKREDLPWYRNDRRRDRLKPVPDEMRADALDPMAAFVAVRRQIMAEGAHEKPVSFRVPVYDGQRRYDVVGKTAAPRTVAIGGKEHAVVTVTATLVPVFGFTERGEERMRESRGRLLFSADARFIPIQVTIDNAFLSGVMNLVADCSVTPDPCGAVARQAAEIPFN